VKNEKQILIDISAAIKDEQTSFFCNFIETMQDEQNLYLLLEYLPGGELLQQVKN